MTICHGSTLLRSHLSTYQLPLVSSHRPGSGLIHLPLWITHLEGKTRMPQIWIASPSIQILKTTTTDWERVFMSLAGEDKATLILLPNIIIHAHLMVPLVQVEIPSCHSPLSPTTSPPKSQCNIYSVFGSSVFCRILAYRKGAGSRSQIYFYQPKCTNVTEVQEKPNQSGLDGQWWRCSSSNTRRFATVPRSYRG